MPSLLVFSLLISNCIAANILGVILHTSYSHQVAFRPLWKQLSLRGHKVTVLTSDPINDPTLTNLTEIDLSVAYEMWRSTDIIDYSEKNNVQNVLFKLMEVGEKVIEAEMTVPAVQKLLNSNASFDLVIAEPFYPIAMMFSYKFNCPLVVAFSTDAPNSLHEMAGNFAHPLIHPTSTLPFDSPLDLFERIASVFGYFAEAIIGKIYAEHNTKLARKYLGEAIPAVPQISTEKASLFIFYLNSAFGILRPMLPVTVALGGGTHVEAPKPLPTDLKQFLDNATEGAVYFSLGSNVFSKNLPLEKRKMILEALAELPFKVLWKFEADDLEEKPKNVKIAKWVPQPDVLRHPNLRVFVTQGGFQSIEEALSAHVPLVVMPKIADQFHNAKRVVNKGMGLRVDFATLTKLEFKEAILEVAYNSKYRQRMKELDELARDQPMEPLEKAVWWIEYVIRHNGTKHLNNFQFGRGFYHHIVDFDVLAVVTTILKLKVAL